MLRDISAIVFKVLSESWIAMPIKTWTESDDKLHQKNLLFFLEGKRNYIKFKASKNPTDILEPIIHRRFLTEFEEIGNDGILSYFTPHLKDEYNKHVVRNVISFLRYIYRKPMQRKIIIKGVARLSMDEDIGAFLELVEICYRLFMEETVITIQQFCK